MNKHLPQRIVILSLLLLSLNSSLAQSQTTEDLQRAFVEMRFGAFIHFGIRTFTGGQWGEPNQDVSKFNPANLDCNQWAEAFAAAKMQYAILTTKHHDGFCLWNSKYTENDVASSPWKDGEGDVVREYVDAFRAHGLEPMLYYSVWDNTAGVGNSTITPDDLEFIKGQITELLSNYGPIKMLFTDGWSWKMGHKSIPYDQIRELVKDLQPGCLLVDNTHLRCLYDNDLIHYESGSPYPSNNTLPAIFSLLINSNSGNGWFWDNRVPTATLLSVNQIVNNNLKKLEPQWCSFILNCPPNPDGKIDDNIVTRLAEVGQAWSPDMTRPQLPAQAAQIEYPITPASAQATSGTATYAIDGLNDRYYYSVWQTTAPLPQNITIDLGLEYGDVSILDYVPKYQPYINPLTEGSIKKYKVSISTDNQNFTEVTNGEWNGDITMKVVTFPPSKARYIRLEAITAVDDFAAATEIAVGRGYYPSNMKNSGKAAPTNFRLNQNFPNPFNESTQICYSVPESDLVVLTIYNLLGKQVQTLVNKHQASNTYFCNFETGELASGIYIYKLLVGRNFATSRKMMLLR